MQNENKPPHLTGDGSNSQQNVQFSPSVTTTPQSINQFSHSNPSIKILMAVIYFMVSPLFLASVGLSLYLLFAFLYALVRHEEGLGSLGLLIWLVAALVVASITSVPTFLLIRRLWRSRLQEQLEPQTTTISTLTPPSPRKSLTTIIWRGFLVGMPLIFAGGLIYSLPHLIITPKTDSAIYGQAATSNTPLGKTVNGTGIATGLAIKVTGVKPDPQTTGDPPNLGLQYVEIDLSLTYFNKQYNLTSFPGNLFYQTDTGEVLATAYEQSVGEGPLFVNSNKNVQITNKQQLTDDYSSKQPGTSWYYLIFQVPRGDKGKLIWYEGYFDTSSTKLAIFDLYK